MPSKTREEEAEEAPSKVGVKWNGVEWRATASNSDSDSQSPNQEKMANFGRPKSLVAILVPPGTIQLPMLPPL